MCTHDAARSASGSVASGAVLYFTVYFTIYADHATTAEGGHGQGQGPELPTSGEYKVKADLVPEDLTPRHTALLSPALPGEWLVFGLSARQVSRRLAPAAAAAATVARTPHRALPRCPRPRSRGSMCRTHGRDTHLEEGGTSRGLPACCSACMRQVAVDSATAVDSAVAVQRARSAAEAAGAPAAAWPAAERVAAQ